MASRTLSVVIAGDTKSLSAALGQAGTATDKAAGKMDKLKGAAKAAAVGGFSVAVAGIGASIKASSDLGEQLSKNATVFGRASGDVQSWSKTTAGSFGISQRAALEATGTFGNMLVPMGLARGKAAEMSKGMVGLASDMASFNNASPEDTLEALRSGLAGETEPLRKFGVFLNASRVEQEAMNLGLHKGKGELSAAAKAQATYSIILKDTKDTQGDFNRTSDSLANQQRIAKARLEDTAAALGQALVPAAAKAIGVVSKLVEWFREHDSAATVIVGTLGTLAAGLVAVKIATVAHSVATGVATAATWLFNTALKANPIVLVVSGLVALAAGLVVAYKKSETFRNIVDTAWAKVKDFAKSVADAWPKVKDFAKAVVDAATAIGGKVGDFITAAKNLVTGFIDGIKGAPGAIADAAKWIVNTAVDGIKSYIETVKGVGGWIVNRVEDGIKAMAGFAADVGGWIKNRVVEGIHNFIEGFKIVGGWIVNRIADGVKAVAGFVAEVGGWVKNRVVEGIHNFREGIVDVGGWITNRIADGVKNIAGFAGEIGGWIKNRVGDAWDFIKGGASKLGESIGGAILGGIMSVLRTGRGFVNAIIDLINAAIPNKLNLPKPLGDINLPDNPIPHLATGARNFRGGLALVGERGPELVGLPRGSDVYTARDTRRMAGAASAAGEVTNVFNINNHGIVDERLLAQRLAFEIATR